MKRCRLCQKDLPESKFHRNGTPRKDGTSGLRTDCKNCSTEVHRRYVNENRERIRTRRKAAYRENKIPAINQNLKRYYGIGIEDYNRMFAEQKGLCKICDLPQVDFSRRFDVDHDHETGRIRGLLCVRCNRGIGLLRDNVEILKRAIKHIQE